MKKLNSIMLLVMLALFSISSVTFAGFFSKKKKGPKVLQFIVSDDKLEGAPIKKMVDKYNEMQKDVEIQVLEYPYKDARTKVKTMISAKRPPALMKVSGIDEFYGTMVDLSDIVDANKYTRGVRSEMTTKNGVIAMPLNLTINGLLYNKDLFKKAGVKVPTSTSDHIWTWEEFEQALKTVVEKTDARYGLAFDYSEHRWKTLMYQFGGHLFSQTGEPELDNPENRKALEYFIHLHDEGIIPEDIWLGGEDSSNLFKTGTIAALYSGSWRVLDFAKNINSFDWGVALMPKAKQRSTIIGGNYIVAFKGSKFEKEAKDFIKWLNSTESYTQLCSYGNYIPARQEIKPTYAVGGNANAIFSLESSEVPESAINDKIQATKYRALSNLLRKNIVFALQGEKTIEQALEDTNKDFLKNKKRK